MWIARVRSHFQLEGDRFSFFTDNVSGSTCLSSSWDSSSVEKNSLDDSVADFLGDAVDVDRDSLANAPDYPPNQPSGLHSYVATAYNYVSHVPYVASMCTLLLPH